MRGGRTSPGLNVAVVTQLAITVLTEAQPAVTAVELLRGYSWKTPLL
jgi:hypothetical protein